jgi:hypothetical protein
MDLKRRIVESILCLRRECFALERKIELKNEGLLEAYSLFNTIRRMKVIERLLDGKREG